MTLAEWITKHGVAFGEVGEYAEVFTSDQRARHKLWSLSDYEVTVGPNDSGRVGLKKRKLAESSVVEVLCQECEVPHENSKWLVLAVINGSTIVGSCNVHDWHTDSPYISSLFVNREVRRCKIGHAILCYAMGKVIKAGKEGLALWVHKDNDLAIHFYKKHGFKFCRQEGSQHMMFRANTVTK